MPRKKNKIRRVFRGKKIKTKPKARICWIHDDRIWFARIVAAAEYIACGEAGA
jgi:hypothetical protein